MTRARWFLPVLASGAALVAGRDLWRRTHPVDLRGQVALITGGSRGLGLALARELAQQGCRLALCARDAEELDRARRSIPLPAQDVLTVVCDVTDRAQVGRMLDQVMRHYGRVDVLINNAGIIMVGPLEHQTLEDFERAMAVMYWGMVYPTLGVLPQMRERRAGHIVNITSIGGKLSVPHLLPYSAAKFAAVGFSEGLRAELARAGVHVLTVVPGLMRTGSHLNAEFKGQHRLEFGLFSLVGTLPITSISGEAAARQIVEGLRRGDAELILGWQAKLMARAQGLAPGLLAEAMGLVNRLLPGPGGIGAERATGFQSRSPVSESPLQHFGREAARRLNQYPPRPAE